MRQSGGLSKYYMKREGNRDATLHPGAVRAQDDIIRDSMKKSGDTQNE